MENSKLEDLKKDLDILDLEERLEMIQLSATVDKSSECWNVTCGAEE